MGSSVDVLQAQWWSPVLLAVWDASAGKPVAVCKCMSGIYTLPLVADEVVLMRYDQVSQTRSTR
jgi:hypothetical protein